MNFAYGVIAIVGVLAAISIGLIVASPDDIIKPRIIPVEEKPTAVAKPEVESEPESAPLTSAVPAPPETYTVRIPDGAGIPGCLENNECFVPSSLPVRVGDTVIWNNLDIAAHTVTSGSIEEPSEIFDSSFFMPGETFVLTFDEAGEYPYFCTLHPWMTGEVVVSEVEEMVVVSEPTAVSEPEPEAVEEKSIEEIVIKEEIVMEEETVMEEKIEEPEAEPEPETLPMTLTVSIPDGVGVPGCEETNECYLPYEVSVAVGATVTWSNDDTAAHTVTSGNFPEDDGLFDSSIFMSGSTFETTFNDAGTFDYYCFVHPWMAGIVNVS